jgi:HlyD family secretion protein
MAFTDTSASQAGSTDTTTVRRGTFVRTLRLAGTVEAVRAVTVTAPRLTGQPPSAALVLTRLVAGGARVDRGDLLAEFDRQEQERIARDRRSELLGLEEQIRQTRAEQAAALAHDDAELAQADHDVERARLAVGTNDLLPKIEADKNTLQLEQNEARLAQLRRAFTLKREAAAADLRILEIQRDRAEGDARHAAVNADVMRITAPFAGLVVLKPVFRAGQMVEVQEGEELRPGVAILDVVDPSKMRVRVAVNQADVTLVATGQPARIQLDAYPDLTFSGRVEQIAPIAVASGYTNTVRMFTAVVSIDGTHPNLMPDLSAAVDVDVQRLDDVLIVPRDAVTIRTDGASVLETSPGGGTRHNITLAGTSATEVAITGGIDEDAVVARGPGRDR